MGILSLKAAIECDGCGTHFRVEIDIGEDLPDGWDFCDFIEDQVRGGAAEHVDKRKVGMSSVQGGKMLCGECTRVIDAEFSEGDPTEPTGDQIAAILDRAAASGQAAAGASAGEKP